MSGNLCLSFSPPLTLSLHPSLSLSVPRSYLGFYFDSLLACVQDVVFGFPVLLVRLCLAVLCSLICLVYLKSASSTARCRDLPQCCVLLLPSALHPPQSWWGFWSAGLSPAVSTHSCPPLLQLWVTGLHEPPHCMCTNGSVQASCVNASTPPLLQLWTPSAGRCCCRCFFECIWTAACVFDSSQLVWSDLLLSHLHPLLRLEVWVSHRRRRRLRWSNERWSGFTKILRPEISSAITWEDYRSVSAPLWWIPADTTQTAHPTHTSFLQAEKKLRILFSCSAVCLFLFYLFTLTHTHSHMVNTRHSFVTTLPALAVK